MRRANEFRWRRLTVWILPACHLIKVDVEGMEIDVLRGAERTIEMYRPLMYLENDRVEHSETLLTLIQKLDYDAYWHLASLFNADNFAGDSEDIFPRIASINVLCLPKESKIRIEGLRRVMSSGEKWTEVTG